MCEREDLPVVNSVIERLLKAISKNLLCASSSFMILNTGAYRRTYFFNDFANGEDLRERPRVRSQRLEMGPVLEATDLSFFMESETELHKDNPFSLCMSVLKAEKTIMKFGFRCINSRDFPLESVENFRKIGTFVSIYTVSQYYRNYLAEPSGVIKLLTECLEEVVPFEKGHGKRVAAIASLFARTLNLGEELISQLFWAGIAHDIGKIAIPMQILSKPGKLEPIERRELRDHPHLGAQIVTSILKGDESELFYRNGMRVKRDTFGEGISAILHHHERWNGEGYPVGLKHEEIPVAARIIALADSYDAMVSERIYRDALGVEEALAEIKRSSGVDFDPLLAEKFLNYVRTSSLFKKTFVNR